jgi:hypothetical protein
MPQCQFPVFCCFCVSEKLHRKYYRNWTKRSSNLLFFPTRDKVRRRAGGGPGTSHTLGWHAPLGRAEVWCGPPWSTSDIALPPIWSLRRKNPKLVGVFPDKVPQRRRHWRPISGDGSLCSGTLPGQGSAPGAISIDSIASTAVSIDFTAISIDVDVSYDEEGVVLPRGWGL